VAGAYSRCLLGLSSSSSRTEGKGQEESCCSKKNGQLKQRKGHEQRRRRGRRGRRRKRREKKRRGRGEKKCSSRRRLEKMWEEEQGWIWKGRPPGLRKDFSRALPTPFWLEEILEGPTGCSSRCGQHKRRTSGPPRTSPLAPAGCASKMSAGFSK